MFIGHCHKANLLMLVSMVFASVGLAFAYIGQIHYAIVLFLLAHIIGLFFGKFRHLFELDSAEVSFAMELEALCRLQVYIILPTGIFIALTSGNIVGLLTSSIYTVAGMIRLAHFNRAAKYIESAPVGYTWGLPFELVALILPLVCACGYFIKGNVYIALVTISMLVMAVLFVMKVKVARLSSKYLLYITLGQVLLTLVFMVCGNFV